MKTTQKMLAEGELDASSSVIISGPEHLAPPTLQWQRECLQDLRSTSLSFGELAVKFNRGRDTIAKLSYRYSVTRPPSVSHGSTPLADMKSISPKHRAIGVRLTLFKDDLLVTDMANLLQVSRTVYKKMEIGAHEFTLTQILRISEVLKTPAPELWAPISVKGPKLEST